MNDLLYNAVNVQKFYGQDNVKVAVVPAGVREIAERQLNGWIYIRP